MIHTLQAIRIPQVPRLVRRLIVPLGLLVLWQVLADTRIVNPRLVSSPLEIVQTVWWLTETGELERHLRFSLWRATAGLSLGVAVGLAAAIIAGLSQRGEDAIDSTVQAIRTLPYLGLVPLFILWFGIGELSRVLLVALGTFFPVYLNVFKSIRNVDERLIDLGRSYGLTRWELIRDIILPAAAPSALVGFRFALGAAWLSLVVAEQINAQAGLGWMIVQAMELAQTSVIMVALAIYAIIGVAADALVRLVEAYVLRWQRSFQGA